ncbi:hypothetical protein GCM10009547_04030 [Sporichthya brevicatena]|uniref:Uncharacterized protein n=1 Tax=Sporichthya brevicatena TaxID=171442 RepID=A0ABN1G777_9ACTN
MAFRRSRKTIHVTPALAEVMGRLDPTERPTFRKAMAAAEGLTVQEHKLLLTEWWAVYDASTPPARIPFFSTGSWNRRIRARQLAKLRAQQAEAAG